LLDQACRLAGSDEAKGWADAAQTVRLPVRDHEDFKFTVTTGLRNGGFDLVDAGVELNDEAVADCRHAFGERVTHRGISIAGHTKRIQRDTSRIKNF
jgi:hypothetical protein